jgi:L-ascorbate metabolism protein UlaG (beta-lactamase superfamily)
MLLASSASAEPLEVTYLANEGFLVRSGDAAFIIDAFVTEPYSIYSAVPADVFARLVDGEAPFDGIDVALVSHPHGDHFQPEAARAFLDRQVETLFVSSPQVVDAVGGAAEGRRAVWPEPGEVVSVERGGVRVDVFRLPHGGARHRTIQNLGHVVHLGGFKVLHVGDADRAERHYEPFDLPAQAVDVALVPYWFLLDADGRRLVERHLRGRHVVAVHIPPGELDDVAERLRREMPEVIVFRRASETRRFKAP